MNGEFNKLEGEVERGMSLLGGLLEVEPSPACVARVKASVVAHARPALLGIRLLRAARPWFGAAAAVLLAVGWMFSSPPSAPTGTDIESYLEDWTAALNETSSRWAGLLDTSGASSDTGGDYESDLDDLLRGLEQSLSSFEAL